jgi:hypothetical protein
MFSISRDGKVEFSTPFEVCPDVSEDAFGIDAKVLADVGAGMVEDDGVAGRLEGVRNWRMSDFVAEGLGGSWGWCRLCCAGHTHVSG